MEEKQSKPSFWAKCMKRVQEVAPLLASLVTIAMPIIECMKHSAKNRSNVRAQQQLIDIRYYDWLRRQEYSRQQANLRNGGKYGKH